MSLDEAVQGLAMRADGTFLVTDEKSGDIRVAMGCRPGLAPRFGGQERAGHSPGHDAPPVTRLMGPYFKSPELHSPSLFTSLCVEAGRTECLTACARHAGG